MFSFYFQAKEIPGIKIFRFEHSLFFVNTEHFKTLIFKKTANPRKLKIAQKKRMSKLEREKAEAHVCTYILFS
jgi:MFS superfamily sulfate permease-like transporter